MLKPRVLLAENDPVVALYLASEFAESGLAIAGIVSDLPRLVRKMSTVPFDVALIAVRLGDDFTFQVARKLKAQHRPFAFITAFASDELPDDLQDIPLVEKPFAASEVIGAVHRLTRFRVGASVNAA